MLKTDAIKRRQRLLPLSEIPYTNAKEVMDHLWEEYGFRLLTEGFGSRFLNQKLLIVNKSHKTGVRFRLSSGGMDIVDRIVLVWTTFDCWPFRSKKHGQGR